MRPYDSQNIFAKILRGEIPAKTYGETEHSLAFHDIAPKAPVHLLLIPKGAYVDLADFSARASAEEIVDFHRFCAEICERLNLTVPGFRAIANAGLHGGQEVPHFHLHLLGGAPLGPLLSPR